MWYAIRTTFMEIVVYAGIAGIVIGLCVLGAANLYDLCH